MLTGSEAGAWQVGNERHWKRSYHFLYFCKETPERNGSSRGIGELDGTILQGNTRHLTAEDRSGGDCRHGDEISLATRNVLYRVPDVEHVLLARLRHTDTLVDHDGNGETFDNPSEELRFR